MSAKTTKASPSQRTRRPSAMHVQKPRKAVGLSREETTPLVLQAREAFDYQTACGKIDQGTKFDDWRRDQVMAAVDRPGISKIDRSQWREVMAHFLILSGHDDRAFELLQKTGQKTDHGRVEDNYEDAETYVALIRQALEEHRLIAEKTVEELAALGAEQWTAANPGIPFPGASAKWIADMAARKAAIAESGKGPIHPGWLIAAARQRTGKPTLTLATMAERLTPQTLHGLLSHVRNSISKREGRADPVRRKIRTYPKPADPGEMVGPF